MSLRKYFSAIVFAAVTILSSPAQAAGKVDLGTVVVTPSRIPQGSADTVQNVSSIAPADMEDSRTDEPAEILESMPALDVVEYGGLGSQKSVFLRGASSSQTLVLIDGRPANSSRDGLPNLDQISMADIERVEVLRGPASSMYGSSAVGGVINVVTKRGTGKMLTELTSKSGSFNTKNVLFNHGNKVNNIDYFVSYDYLTSRGHRDNGGYMSNAGDVKLGYQFDPGHHLGLACGYYNGETGSPGPVTAQELDDRQESFNRYFDLTYDGSFFDGQQHFLKFYHQLDRLEYIETYQPLDKNTHQTQAVGIDAQYSQKLSDDLRLAFGESYQNHGFNSSVSSKHAYNSKALYYDFEYAPIDKLTLKHGLRWDDYSNFGDRFSPSGGFNLWFIENAKLHVLCGKSFRAPTFNDLYWPATAWSQGNPTLRPESGVSYEAGFTGYITERFTADLTLFKTRYKDLIEWAPSGAVWTPSNVGASVSQGVEMTAGYKLADWLDLNGSYTYTESKNLYTKKWLIYHPRHLYKLQVEWEPISGLEIKPSGVYKTKVFTDTDNAVRLKHIALLNLYTGYKINNSLKIFFEIKNVFNRTYQEVLDYSMPGRAFYGGATFKF